MQTCSKCNKSLCLCSTSDDYATFPSYDSNDKVGITFDSSSFFAPVSYSITLNEQQIEDIADRVADIVCEKVLDRLVEKILLVEKGNDED